VLSPAAARQLARTISALPTGFDGGGGISTGCPIQIEGARRLTDIIVFTYPGRADVDLLYGPACFSYIDNGFITTGVPGAGL